MKTVNIIARSTGEYVFFRFFSVITIKDVVERRGLKVAKAVRQWEDEACAVLAQVILYSGSSC